MFQRQHRGVLAATDFGRNDRAADAAHPEDLQAADRRGLPNPARMSLQAALPRLGVRQVHHQGPVAGQEHPQPVQQAQEGPAEDRECARVQRRGPVLGSVAELRHTPDDLPQVQPLPRCGSVPRSVLQLGRERQVQAVST